MRKIIFALLMIVPMYASAANESTPFGKITGIESRPWGMHIQTTFAGGAANNCPVSVGATYMYDFRYDNPNNGVSANDEVSMILSAFTAQSDIAFHIYGCNDAGNRPLIGYIRLKK